MQPVAKIWPAMRYEAPSCPARRASAAGRGRCADTGKARPMAGWRPRRPLPASTGGAGFVLHRDALPHRGSCEGHREPGGVCRSPGRLPPALHRRFRPGPFRAGSGRRAGRHRPAPPAQKGPGAKRSIGNRDDGAIIRRHSRSSPAGGRAFGGRGILRPRSARRKSRIGRRPLLRSRPSVRQSPC